MKSVEPIDKADMIYPELGEDEIVVPKIRKNILLHATETHYFPLDFRMRNVVIDSIARKYDCPKATSPKKISRRFICSAPTTPNTTVKSF